MSKFDFATPHKYVVHRHCTRDHCPVCDGGLAICEVCNLAEGSLTTHCPGYNCSMSYSDPIFKGELDYRNGAWIDLTKKPSNLIYLQFWKRESGVVGMFVGTAVGIVLWFLWKALTGQSA